MNFGGHNSAYDSHEAKTQDAGFASSGKFCLSNLTRLESNSSREHGSPALQGTFTVATLQFLVLTCLRSSSLPSP